MTTDIETMSRAIQVARHGLYTCHPNPRVGCVIVKDDKLISEGWHEKTGGPHAEIRALKLAKSDAKDATLYVTLEPCCHQGKTGPCTDAIIKAGVKRVVVGMADPNPKVAGLGIIKLREAGIEVVEGVLTAQAEALNPGFIKRMREGRPFVRCKLAMSLDGRTAMASGESKWITGPEARADVQRLRAQSSAILTGIGTILADDPSLSVRIDGVTDQKNFTQPMRVILDPRLSTPPLAKTLSEPGRILIVTSNQDPEIVDDLSKAGAEIMYQPGQQDSIDLKQMMQFLAEQEINEVLLETGATLSGAMLRAGLIDEMIFYMAPHLMGNSARGLFNLPGLDSLAQRINLDISDIRAVGKDWRITARVTQ